LGVGSWALKLLLILDVLWQAFQLLQEDERSMRGDLETLAARSARDVIIDADQMVFALAEQRAIAIVGAGWNLRFFRAAHPPDGIVVGASAARALEAGGALLRFLGEELTLVHAASVPRRPLQKDGPYRARRPSQRIGPYENESTRSERPGLR
jgi:hypothetical protein